MATFLRRDDWITDAMGNAQSGAQVYVCSQPATTTSIPPSPLVQLYSDPLGANPISQPVIADGYGHAFYYVAPGTYTIVYYSPQIQEVILADQTIGTGNVSFPITIPEGGTDATTAAQALINLGAAASGTNADITSLLAIPSTTINSSGYAHGTVASGTGALLGATNLTIGQTGEVGSGMSVGCGLPGQTGGGIICYAVGGASGMDSTGFFGGNIQLTGNSDLHNGTVKINTLVASDPGTLTFTPTWSVTQPTIGFLLNGVTSTSQKCLLGFENYPTQTTVGAAGAASALPATPSIYLQLRINGTTYVFPGYAQA